MRSTKLVLITVVLATAGYGCSRGSSQPRHRERDPARDRECKDATRPRAYFYAAENRTDYKPDDPRKDGCELLVADHLFCCQDKARPTDR